jgi:hypothetical protein
MLSSRRFALLCLAALALTAGCTVGEAAFDPVVYDRGNLTVMVATGAPIVHADLQVAVSALDALGQHEVFAEARYVDLAAGANRFTYAVQLPDGAYRCYLHLYDGQQRRGAVIRELTISGGAGRA